MVFEKEKVEVRVYILEGLCIVLDYIDEIIVIICGFKLDDEVKVIMIEWFDLFDC